MSRDALEKERADFWATRVTNIQEVWNYLKMACEALLEGDAGTANAIAEAAGVRTPHGNLSVCYDERGAEYRVPEFCYSTPVADGDSPRKAVAAKQKAVSRGTPGVALSVRLRVAGWQKDFALGLGAAGGSSGLTDAHSVGELKTFLADAMKEAGVSAGGPSAGKELPEHRMRIIYAGKTLDDNDQLLREAGVKDKAVVQVFPRPG